MAGRDAPCVDLTADLAGDAEPKAVGRETTLFDETVGHLQSILLEDGFSDLHQTFLEEHYSCFDDSEENKFIYTDIFKQYTELIESYLERELQSRMPSFNMHTFLQSLEAHKDEIVEEVFDLLHSCLDFLTFKQTMLSYKAAKEGKSLDLSGLIITPLSSNR